MRIAVLLLLQHLAHFLFACDIDSSTECFGLHGGDPQTANLGDGNGWVDQDMELRQDYGNAAVGTCLESLIGGNHFRSVLSRLKVGSTFN